MIIHSGDEPLGFLIGSLIKSDSEWTTMIFLSIVAGIFVYVACTEILTEVMNSKKYILLKAFTFLVGIAFMIGVSFIPGHEHDHEGETHDHDE